MASSYNELFGLGSHSEDANLEAWWKFQDDAATTTIVDESSNAVDMTLAGGDNTADLSVTGPTSYLLKALLFNGVDDVADTGSALVSGTPTTIGGWFKTPASPAAVSRLAGHFVGTDVVTIGLHWNDATEVFVAQHYDGSDAAATSSHPLSTWFHVVGTFGSDATRTLWVDGVSKATDTTSQSSIGTINNFIVGNSPWGGGGQYSDFTKAGLFCFSRALTGPEIAETGAGPEPLNTVAPVVSGTETEDETLSCTTGTWNNQANGTNTFGYQWTRSNDGAGSGEADIVGATSATYVLVTADVGKFIRCRVAGSNDGGNDPGADTNSNITGAIAAAAVPSSAQVTQNYAEVVTSSVPAAQSSQSYVEVVSSFPPPAVRTTQSYSEVVLSVDAVVDVTQHYTEVVYRGLLYCFAPNGDLVIGNWTPSPSGTLTCTPASCVSSSLSPATDSFQVSLPSFVLNPDSTLEVIYKFNKADIGGIAQDDGDTLEITIQLLQGVTVIASWTHLDVQGDEGKIVQVLTPAQFALLIDGNNLSLKVIADTTVAGTARLLKVCDLKIRHNPLPAITRRMLIRSVV